MVQRDAMHDALLTTKLYRPQPRPNLVQRPRLLAQLNAGLGPSTALRRKLTLISAPAGFGKTTLVSHWLHGLAASADSYAQPTESVDIAWLSLAEEDGEVNRFLRYVVAALQTASKTEPVGQEILDALTASEPPPVEMLLTTLLNEIARLPGVLLLVLDDYHLVDSRAVDRALTFLLEHLPPQLHLVITTREDPNLPLARMRVRGELTEIRADDLRFSAAEVAAFLNEMMGLALTAAEVDALEERTEGWIAGLQLAALSMQGRSDRVSNKEQFIETFTGSHRFVMDYLVTEVLEQQPAHIQRFLLQTSLLDRLCGPLCDALLDDPSASGQEILERLEQANLFLTPLDHGRRWYRYHHLFADLLRQRHLAQPGIDAAEIHRRASIWFEDNGLIADALRHALAAPDRDRAAALLERSWRTMDDDRQTMRWLGWAQQLPDVMIRNRPVLSAGYGWALLESGELEGADTWLGVAEAWLDTLEKREATPDAEMLVADEAEFRALPATIAAARTYYALALGDVAGTKRYAQRTLDLLPAESHQRRGIPATLLGLAHWTDGELTLACRVFADGVASFRLADNLLFAVTGAYILADMKRAQGHLREAEQILQQWLDRVTDQGPLLQRGAADLHTGMAELACEWADLEAAAAHLQKSEELAGQSPPMRWRYRWSLAGAQLKAEEGQFDEALELFTEAEAATVRGPVPDVRPVAAVRARVWLMQGQLTEAWAWSTRAGVAADDELSYLREYEHLTLVRLLIAQHRHAGDAGDTSSLQEALALLARLLPAAQAGERTASVIEILALQALVHAAHDDLASALDPLAHALILAEPQGYVRLFTGAGAPMARLLQAAASHDITPIYTRQLLAAFTPVTATPTPQHHPTTEASPLVEPLSERELEVLGLVARGFSNREISKKLYLSIHTVKGHNRRIYAKLAVSRRTEAVARAQELGLV